MMKINLENSEITKIKREKQTAITSLIKRTTGTYGISQQEGDENLIVNILYAFRWSSRALNKFTREELVKYHGFKTWLEFYTDLKKKNPDKNIDTKTIFHTHRVRLRV